MRIRRASVGEAISRTRFEQAVSPGRASRGRSFAGRIAMWSCGGWATSSRADHFRDGRVKRRRPNADNYVDSNPCFRRAPSRDKFARPHCQRVHEAARRRSSWLLARRAVFADLAVHEPPQATGDFASVAALGCMRQLSASPHCEFDIWTPRECGLHLTDPKTLRRIHRHHIDARALAVRTGAMRAHQPNRSWHV